MRAELMLRWYSRSICALTAGRYGAYVPRSITDHIAASGSEMTPANRTKSSGRRTQNYGARGVA